MSHPDLLITVIELDDLSSAEALRAARMRWCDSVIREFRQSGTPSMGFCFDFDGTNHGSGMPFVLDPVQDDCFLRVATKEDGALSRREAGSKACVREHEIRVLAEVRKLQRNGGARGLIHQFGKHPSLVTSEDLLSGLLSFLVQDVIDG